jgi:serine/threonine-protein kinase
MSLSGSGDRYQLLSRIATGGMGEVWRAEDTVLDREVAVKVLKHEYADDPTFRERFEAEARHAAGLNHPNIASVFDVGEIDDHDGSGTRRPFLVLELVPGQPLSELLRSGQPLAPEQAAEIAAQAADGIAAAHAMGLVHRDVKPANLLVAPEGTVKITDFGIARVADGAAFTQTGQIIGTPHYISPEQAEGAPATAASDIYALGVVLYECLAGTRPFARDTPIQVALAHVREPVPPLGPDVPSWLRAVVDRSLAKRPEDRYASAGEFAAALRAGPAAAPTGGAAPVEATQVMAVPAAVAPAGAAPTGAAPLASAGRRAGRRFRWWPWAAAGVVVLALALASAAFAAGGDPAAPAVADSSAPSTPDRSEPPTTDRSGQSTTDSSDATPALAPAKPKHGRERGRGHERAHGRGLGHERGRGHDQRLGDKRGHGHGQGHAQADDDDEVDGDERDEVDGDDGSEDD